MKKGVRLYGNGKLKGKAYCQHCIKKAPLEDEQFVTYEQLKKEYRLESITLPETINEKEMKWEIDLLNLKDGFSRIIIELENNKPFHYSVEA